MSAITFDYKDAQIQELTLDDVENVGGGLIGVVLLIGYYYGATAAATTVGVAIGAAAYVVAKLD